MPTTLPILEVIDIARPCPADWDAMRGNERARFCDHCQKHVYNLSSMTPEAIEALIIEKEGKLCGRLYRRADGSVVTADCGGGWKLRARKLGTLIGVAMATVISGICSPYVFSQDRIDSGQAMDSLPPGRMIERIFLKLKGETPAPPPPPRAMMVMGVIACPPPKQLPQPQTPPRPAASDSFDGQAAMEKLKSDVAKQ